MSSITGGVTILPFCLNSSVYPTTPPLSPIACTSSRILDSVNCTFSAEPQTPPTKNSPCTRPDILVFLTSIFSSTSPANAPT